MKNLEQSPEKSMHFVTTSVHLSLGVGLKPGTYNSTESTEMAEIQRNLPESKGRRLKPVSQGKWGTGIQTAISLSALKTF